MSRRRHVPNPFSPANNPWSQNLRFFTVFDMNLCNYAGPTGVGDYHNLSSNSPLAPTAGTAGYPGQIWDGTNHDYVTWSQWDGQITGAVTVIARWKPLAGAIGSALGTWQNNNGFALNFISGTFGAEDGVEMVVGETGTNLLISSGSHASFEGIEATVGGRYDSASRTVDIWQNGVKLATNTDVAKAWNTTTTTDLASGLILGTSQFFSGSLYWVACFDRALTDAEMEVWTTQDPLDLLLGPDPLLVFVQPTWAVATTIGAGAAWQDASPWIVSTPLVASADSGGSVPSAPGPGTVWNCGTVVGVPTSEVLVTGQLFAGVQTVIGVAAAASLTSIWGLATSVGVSTAVATGLDGQTNVLASGRFRR